MPGFNLHFLLALSAVSGAELCGWNRRVRAAFLAGAVAPDMGYVPGGAKFVSDLSHFLGSGRLARTLLASAESAEERAYAWGWATHVLADALIHPLINRAAAVLIPGANRPVLTCYDHPVAHIRIEQGLDAVIAAQFDASAFLGIHPRSPPQVVGVLARVYRNVYGIDAEPELRTSCRSLDRSFPIFARYTRLAGTWLNESVRPEPGPIGCAAFAVARTISGFLPRSPMYALTHPVRPNASLHKEVLSIIDSFPAQMKPLLDGMLHGLPDYNLDTGEIGGEYAPTVVALRELIRRGGQIRMHPSPIQSP